MWGENTHTYTLLEFLQLAFIVGYVKKFSPDSSYKLNSGQWNCRILALFPSVCLFGSAGVCVCVSMFACTALFMKYLACPLLHNAVMRLHTQHCLQTGCFSLTSPPLTFKLWRTLYRRPGFAGAAFILKCYWPNHQQHLCFRSEIEKVQWSRNETRIEKRKCTLSHGVASAILTNVQSQATIGQYSFYFSKLDRHRKKMLLCHYLKTLGAVTIACDWLRVATLSEVLICMKQPTLNGFHLIYGCFQVRWNKGAKGKKKKKEMKYLPGS